MQDFSADLEKHITKIGKDVQTFVERLTEEFTAETAFSPLADVMESENEFQLLMDVPGCEKEDLTISLKNSVLTIAGERKIATAESHEFKKRERQSGSFSRSFALPDDVSAAEIKASFKNGVLSVVLPKSSVLRNPTNIKID
jgi:HSP20 family protein